MSTTASTIMSTALLPLNLLIYLSLAYDSSVLDNMRLDLLYLSVGVVTAAVLCGLAGSLLLSRREPAFVDVARRRLNIAGNVAGLLLILLSVVFSSRGEPVWNKAPSFYVTVAAPAVAALALSTGLTSLPYLDLSRPERVAVAVECTYQNTGIATSLALSMFDASDASRAAGVPLYYGTVQLVLIATYLLICWRCDWTYAPPTDALWKVVGSSYQHVAQQQRAGGRLSRRQVGPEALREEMLSATTPRVEVMATHNDAI